MTACLLLAAVTCGAQLIRTKTYEVALTEEHETRQVLRAGDDHLMVYKPFLQNGRLMINFSVLDTALQETLSGGIDFGNDKSIQLARFGARRMWFLTRFIDKSRDFGIYGVFMDSAIYTYSRFLNVIPFQPLFFEANGSGAVVAGYYNSRPVALFCNFRTGESKLLPGFFNLPGEINQVTARDDGKFDVLLVLKTSGYRKSAYLNRYGPDGELEKSTVVGSGKERSLMFARQVRTGGDSILIAGIYGNRSETSRGFFIAAVNAEDTYTLRFYNFGDLPNFFRFLRPGRQERIRERIERKKSRGKPLRFPYRMLVHDFAVQDGNLVLLAEAFYPTYRSGNAGMVRQGSTGIFTYIKPFYPYQRDMVFDGFRYTHGIALGISKSGTIQWDNSLPLRNIKTFNLQQFMQYVAGGENGYLVYATEDGIAGTMIRGSEVTGLAGNDPGKQRADARLPSVEPGRNRVFSWYGNTLIQSGIREVRREIYPGQTTNILVFHITRLDAR
ncbi:MAG: hypothetical protein ACKO3B_10385 [Bacteroidota bacterium]